jgi:hypothetical protein
MTKNIISGKGIEAIIDAVKTMKEKEIESKSMIVEGYDVSIYKNNGTTNITVCYMDENDAGFSRRKFNSDTGYTAIYNMIKNMPEEAFSDVGGMTDWN